ncbi:hypothetical protein HDU67_009337 [Dinochytrium kinnereticum]|nr:hypothetical protein HDU67_009337 [Dinochytrium kinnereticum]
MYITRIWTQEDSSARPPKQHSKHSDLDPIADATLVFETKTNLTGTSKLRVVKVSDIRPSSGFFSTWEIAKPGIGWLRERLEMGYLVDTTALRNDPIMKRVVKVVESNAPKNEDED